MAKTAQNQDQKSYKSYLIREVYDSAGQNEGSIVPGSILKYIAERGTLNEEHSNEDQNKVKKQK